ncbi:PROTEIN putative-RELATED [Salix purpurea]|uniref:PROTEIN putative-RELATED n=1 Tax=Salix purpurea TaxID=77065 RepID=A0A9Q1A922_SALPP|nr:PROTEIN putative-RELATED [Salix purpurea]
MAANLRPHLAFQQQSVIMQHGVFTLLVGTLISLIQVKYQSSKASPFDGHDVIMSVLLAAIFTYATASVAEVMLLARESPNYGTLAGNLRLFAGALAAISLLAILDPVLGFITSAVWACLLIMAVAYESRTEIRNILGTVSRNLIDMFTRLAARGRSRAEQPNQPPV